MPNVLPTIPQEPAQGIQAQLDLVYLFNPDVANGLIEQVNELLEELGELSNISGKIKPYAELEAPVQQYMPTTYGDGLYVANDVIDVLPTEFDPTQWTLIATKIDRTAITQEINTAVGNEATARAGADNNLQSQIDAISASSDVKDIVGTYAELEDYDTSTLGNNDIIKVLQDETQQGATTYYRWIAATQQFSLIGSEGPYYTKSQTDGLLDDKQDTLIAGEGITIENNVISSTGGASGDFVPQYAVMPVASSENVGTLVQYSGPTTENTKASATGEQTVGSGIGSITVNVNTFEQAEQPTGDETVTFVADVSGTGGFAPVAEIGTTGNYAYFNTAKLCAYIAQYTDHTDYKYVSVRHNSSNSNSITMYMNSGAFPASWGGTTTYKQVSNITDSDLENDVGITLSNYEYTSSTKAQSDWSDATIEWTRDGAPVNIALYGISVGGIPTDGSEIEITYNAFKYGYGHGYFYTCSEDYSDPTLRIEQSSGSDLFNIAINFDTFVEKEQPTGNETLNFAYDTIAGSFEYTTESGFEGLTIDTEGIVAELDRQGYGNYVANFTSGGIDRDENNGYTISVYSSRYWQTITMNVDSYISGSASDYGRVATITSMSPQVTGWFDEEEVVVTPSEYGVSYDGEPTDGDVLTIYYTAPALLGYVWNQTNVQPSGKIEWTKKWVNDVSGATDRALYPIFDALEDGQYEWYYSVGTQDAYTVRYQTFKAEFAIRHEGTNFYLSGTLNWIIDGSTSFNGGNMLSNMYALYANRNSAKTLFTMKTIYVNVGGYSAINTPLFMCTDVKNVKTGDTFPVKIETEEPNFSSNIGEINTGYPVDVNINSSNSDWAVITTTEMATYVGLRFQIDNDACEFIIRAYCGNDQFEATMRNIGTLDKKRWVARIDRATGILSGAYIAQNIWGDSLYMYHGITSSNDALHAQGTRIGMNVKQNWVGWSGEQNLPDGSDIILCTTVNVGNTVTPDNYGLIEQYTGATNANYTNGYFYKAAGTPVSTPASMTALDVSPTDCDVTVDADDLVAAIVNWTGWTRDTVISRLSDNYQFTIYWDANNNNVTRVYWGAYGEFNEDSGIPALFSVTTTGAYYSTVILYAYFTYTAEGTEIQNGHWEQVNVQPGGSGQTIQYSSFPAASSSLEGTIGQYVGATDANYTNGYFYKCQRVVTPASATASQTAGSSLTNIVVNVSTLETGAQTYNIDLTQPIVFVAEEDILVEWYYGSTNIGYWLDDVGITFDGTAVGDDEITVVYTPESSTYAWVRCDTQPSDFVPLTGGTMSGSLRFVNTDLNMHGAIFGHTDGVKFGSVAQDGVTVTTIGGWVSYGILPAQNATQNVGSGTVKWNKIFVTRINNGEDIAIPAMYGTMGVQVSSFPTADSAHEGQIYQFTGATDATYTNGRFYKCVSDGGNPATYSWEEVSLGGASYTAGNGISIDANNEISVAAPTLVNKATTQWLTSTVGIGDTTVTGSGSIGIGMGITASGSSCVVIGRGAYSNVDYSIAIGRDSRVTSNYGIAFGYGARVAAQGAIQIGTTGSSVVNSDANTLKVANTNGNFELMNANGNLPADRLASTTGLADGNYRLRLTMSNGTPTLSWVAE